jgi:hypothetical protein
VAGSCKRGNEIPGSINARISSAQALLSFQEGLPDYLRIPTSEGKLRGIGNIQKMITKSKVNSLNRKYCT